MSSDRVLVVIGRTRHKMVVAELQEAVKRGAKFIELRLDFLAKAIDFKRLAAVQAVPVGRHPPPPGRRRPVPRHRAGAADRSSARPSSPAVRVGGPRDRHRRHHPAVRHGQADRQLPQPGRDARRPRGHLRADAQAGRRRVQDRRRRPRRPTTSSACSSSSKRPRSRPSRSAWATSACRAGSWRSSTAPRGSTPRSTRSAASPPGCRRSTSSGPPIPVADDRRRDAGVRRRRRPGRAQPQPAPAQPHVPAARGERPLPAVPRAARAAAAGGRGVRRHPGARLQRHHPAQGGGRAAGAGRRSRTSR